MREAKRIWFQRDEERVKVDELKEVEVAVEMMVVEEFGVVEVLEVEETVVEVVLVVEAEMEEVLKILAVSC